MTSRSSSWRSPQPKSYEERECFVFAVSVRKGEGAAILRESLLHLFPILASGLSVGVEDQPIGDRDMTVDICPDGRTGNVTAATYKRLIRDLELDNQIEARELWRRSPIQEVELSLG